MWLVGSCYNLLWAHRSLGEERTPATAAGLTDQRWSMEELLSSPVPPAELPRWWDRKPKWILEIEKVALPQFNVALPAHPVHLDFDLVIIYYVSLKPEHGRPPRFCVLRTVRRSTSTTITPLRRSSESPL